ncbi:MAG: UDP-glucose--hexose-1-phosphate uridylyltransferase [Ignavibacteriales bacterium]|nr:UDP-glucose--hexose-1-phosphate uridylyltransferase [Ignavibacteriales bacterium]
MFDIENRTHKRYNILTDEWILVSSHRSKRPWQGKIEQFAKANLLTYDPECYLCPKNSRAGGVINPDYKNTFVFENDFSALTPESNSGTINHNGLIRAEVESGICKVVCFSPRHDLSLAEMDQENLLKIIDTWINEYRALSLIDGINYVTIFENKGELMGCSNRHPHGQIWAQFSIPNEPLKESVQQKKYFDEKKSCLLCDYLKKESELNQRIIFQNEHFALLVPFWAIWPYETFVIPKNHSQNILSLSDELKKSLAEILSVVTVKYDNLFETSFPYSMGFHQSPTDSNEHPEWHWHIHFYPPLLRSASVKKFMVGYEMLAMAQRDLTPELAAEILKNLSNKHFSRNSSL